MRPIVSSASVKLTVTAALGLAVALAVPASARAPRYVALAGTTTITASQSGSAIVDVPDDATLSWKELGNPDIDFSGTGRLTGVLLDPIGQPAFSADSVLLLRMPKSAGGALEVFGLGAPTEYAGCTQPGEDPTEPLGSCAPYHDPGYGVLYEGRYRMTVLTDGAPLTITLTLHGLSGDVRVSPTSPLATTEGSMTARAGVGDRLISAGTQAMTMPKDGVYLFYAKVKRASGVRVRTSSMCTVDGRLAALPVAYLPGSCGGFGGVMLDPMQYTSAGSDGFGFGLGWGGLQAGSYGMGFNAGGDTAVSFTDGVVAFVPGVS